MKVNIVKGPRQNETIFENYAHWGDNVSILNILLTSISTAPSLQPCSTEIPLKHVSFSLNLSISHTMFFGFGRARL